MWPDSTKHAYLTTKNCKQLLSKILVKVWKKCLRHLKSVLQQFHAIYRVLKDKKLNKWVPHKLNEHQKLKRFEVCSMLCVCNINDLVLDESPKHFQSQGCIRKILWWQFGGLQSVLYTTAFWNQIRALLPRFTTINLQTGMLPCKKEVCLGNWCVPILLHDNVLPHVARLTMQKLTDLGYKTLPHPLYYPDLLLNDFRDLSKF